MPVQTSISIQLDASLVSGPEPAAALDPVTETPQVVPRPMRLTDEMRVPPSGTTTRDAGTPERTSSSFQIDPALTAETPVVASAQGTLASGNLPVDLATHKRRQSGNFSPIEKDFFEREAELYKVEGAESFADLDENRAKAGTKSAASKKASRPSRK
jgi:hypothetical protein